MSNTLAKPTPTTFCTKINAPTIAVKITSGRPPAFRREKSALKPMDEKKISIKASCSGFSNFKLNPVNECSTVINTAATKPPATGSGILKSCKNLILCTKNLPNSKTMVAAIKV